MKVQNDLKQSFFLTDCFINKELAERKLGTSVLDGLQQFFKRKSLNRNKRSTIPF